MTRGGEPMRCGPCGGLVCIGFDAPGRVYVTFGMKRAARLQRDQAGRWAFVQPRGPAFDDLDAALDWLTTPAGAPLPLLLPPATRKFL